MTIDSSQPAARGIIIRLLCIIFSNSMIGYGNCLWIRKFFQLEIEETIEGNLYFNHGVKENRNLR